jgi:hypothetical protein
MKLESSFQVKVLGSRTVAVSCGKDTGEDIEPTWIEWGLRTHRVGHGATLSQTAEQTPVP